ncbi:MAG: sn-glycerol-3-phosphate ABC transporter ATP-binding protein UgpC [Bdellovibrionales bacterium]|nr:sn-glycerol-3-phosphate ABC transporter ATP-binding protein UgpC [Bdellovibrionales bacterium]
MAGIELQNVRKDFGTLSVIKGVDLEIHPGEFVVFVGPSGCGKSTLLRMVAGLETVTSGTIRIGDRIVNDVSPKERGVAMVFQNYALYPHMTVADNIGFSLKLSRVPKAEIKKRVEETARVLRIVELLPKKPGQLSGGQKQRVAMGRAMIRNPKVFLFDEPLSNLDAQLRIQMRSEIALLHRRVGATVIYVTHDQVEAMTLADRIVVLHAGHIEQVGAPLDVYRNPQTQFVASFIGTPPMNFVPAQRFPAASLPTKWNGSLKTVGFRAEKTAIGKSDGLVPIGNGRVRLVEPLGLRALVHVELGDQELVTEIDTLDAPSPDSEVPLGVAPADLFYFDQSGRSLGAPL